MYVRRLLIILFLVFESLSSQKTSIITVLGTVQDGGLPHIGCEKHCCNKLSSDFKVTSLGLTLPDNQGFYLFEASPNFPDQLKYMTSLYESSFNGVFLTHAHIGHYTGLMYLGKEALGAKNIPVFAMTRMSEYLVNNGPWSQLISDSNIELINLKRDEAHRISKNISIKPIIVPHRDEFSETVGYFIYGSKKTAFFLPDIDKWDRWSMSLNDIVKSVDVLFLDGTFYDNSEINYRPIESIPHPFVAQTMETLKTLSINDKQKIYFIHMNHTNPMLDQYSNIALRVLSEGFNIAKIGQTFEL
ncbi:MAG: MBL fold metallo-hydrolase [Flavobacteriaceae bacterium]|nr:MBL fold metallo-hydrolase [Flavobacteriaceae bacterium]